jgi:DNA mismatch repair ATPase MutL
MSVLTQQIENLRNAIYESFNDQYLLTHTFSQERTRRSGQYSHQYSQHSQHSQHSQQSIYNTSYHTTNHASIPWYYWLLSPTHTTYTTNNNYTTNVKSSKKTEKDDDENKPKNQSNPILGGLIIAGSMLIGTYILTQDGYIKILRSDIRSRVNDVKDISYTQNQFDNVQDVIEACENWIKLYNNRTIPIFQSKIGILASLIGTGIGFYIGHNMVTYCSIGMGVLAASYLIWNSFGNQQFEENNAFCKMITELNKSIAQVQKLPQESSQSSQPPNYDDLLQNNTYPAPSFGNY